MMARTKAKRPPGKMVLRLYVAGTSDRSMRAIVNARELLDEHIAGRYELEVIDLFQQPTLARDDQIVYSNSRFALLIGTRLETLIGSSLATHAAEGSRKLVEALVGARGNGAVKAEVELVAADGTHIPVYMSATAASDDSMNLTSLVVTDLSAQKRDQEMLAAGRLNAHIVEHAAQGIVVCDRDGVIVRANQPVQALVGDNPLLRRFEAAIRFDGAPELARSIVHRALGGQTVRGGRGARHGRTPRSAAPSGHTRRMTCRSRTRPCRAFTAISPS